MKAKEEIQHSGFMNNLHRINGKPSESDVERVKEIYRRSIEAEGKGSAEIEHLVACPL